LCSVIFLKKKGLIDGIIKKYSNIHDRCELLVIVLANLFYTIPIKSPSKVQDMKAIKLPPLPPEFEDALKEYNNETMEIYTQYVECFITHISRDSNAEEKLPLSKKSFPIITDRELAKDKFVQYLEQYRIPYTACSSFVALSGHSDTFTTPADLIKSVNANMILDESSIPIFNQPKNINSYILKFWKKDIDKLELENG